MNIDIEQEMKTRVGVVEAYAVASAPYFDKVVMRSLDDRNIWVHTDQRTRGQQDTSHTAYCDCRGMRVIGG